MAIKSTTIGEGDGNIRPQPHAPSQKTIFESKISQAEPQFIVEKQIVFVGLSIRAATKRRKWRNS